MKRLLCCFLLLLILPAVACADVLAPDWQAAALDDLLAAQTLLANEISARRAADQPAAEKIELSGTGTDILTGVSVAAMPVRVSFVSDAEAKATLTGGRYSHTFHNYASGSLVEFLDDAADYSVLVETTGAWSLTFEPLAAGQALPFSGTGDAVSDIFDITAPMIVTFSWDLSKYDKILPTFRVELKHQNARANVWGYDPLVSELSPELVGSRDVILKPVDGCAAYCFAVEAPEGVSWSIAPKQ